MSIIPQRVKSNVKTATKIIGNTVEVRKANPYEICLHIGSQSFFSDWTNSEFSISSSASYSKFSEKISGVLNSLFGDVPSDLMKLNDVRSVYTGKKLWNPGWETSTFDCNSTLSFTIPLIFVNDAGGISNLRKLKTLLNTTCPVIGANNQLILPGPHISNPESERMLANASAEFSKAGSQMSSGEIWSGVKSGLSGVVSTAGGMWKAAKSTYNGSTVSNISVSFEVGNWLRIDEVVVKGVETKMFPILDRKDHAPAYAEVDVSLETYRPPTADDISRWIRTETNRT